MFRIVFPISILACLVLIVTWGFAFDTERPFYPLFWVVSSMQAARYRRFFVKRLDRRRLLS